MTLGQKINQRFDLAERCEKIKATRIKRVLQNEDKPLDRCFLSFSVY